MAKRRVSKDVFRKIGAVLVAAALGALIIAVLYVAIILNRGTHLAL